MDKLDRLINSIRRKLNEDAVAVNSLGGGNIAGTSQAGDDPPVRKKKRYIYPKDKKGYRTLWFKK